MEIYDGAAAANGAVGFVANRDVWAKNLTVHVTQASVRQPQNPVTSLRMVEAPIHTFQGRHHLLEKIHKTLQECLTKDHFMRRIVALVAMGGMGKTETARKLVHQYHAYYENVAWIDAETESSVRQSFAKIIETLNISYSSNSDAKGLAQLVYMHVSTHIEKPTLFIFDNANQLKTDGNAFGVFDYLPSQVASNLPLILLTSQTAEWGMHQCELIHVIELNAKESMNILQSRFKLTNEDIEGDCDLGDLLSTVIEKLNGFPLALGLAAANIPYIPGQGSLELLKQNLKKYIQRVEDNGILEQRLNSQLASDYPHTLIKVWDTAMKNLERRGHGHGAKNLLYILAYFPEEDLDDYRVKQVYEERSETFRVTFPNENDASFEEALHELQTVGLARIHWDSGAFFRKYIKVHRLVQMLARREDDGGLCFQKLILCNITNQSFSSLCVDLSEEQLMPKGGVPSWALEDETRALLWLQGLQFVRHQGTHNVSRNYDGRWKNQLAVFPNGGDIALVAEFLLENKLPNYWHRETSWNVESMLNSISKALEVRSSLAGKSQEIQVFLELLLIRVVARSAKITSDRLLQESLEKTLDVALSGVWDSFKAWISDFDFSIAINTNYLVAEDMVVDTVQELTQAYKKISLVIPEVLVAPKALTRLADVKSARREDGKKPGRQLASIWNPEDVKTELVWNDVLLDRVSRKINDGSFRNLFPCLGILQQLVGNSECLQQVLRHGTLIPSLEWTVNTCLHSEFWCSDREECRERYNSSPISVTRYRRTDRQQTGRTFQRVVKCAIQPCNSYTEEAFIIYRSQMVYFRVYIKHSEEKFCTKETLEELLPLEECVNALVHFVAFVISSTSVIEDNDWTKLCKADKLFLSEDELTGDKHILSGALKSLKSDSKAFGEDYWHSQLLLLAVQLQKLNGYFLYLMEVEAEPGMSCEDSFLVTDSEDDEHLQPGSADVTPLKKRLFPSSKRKNCSVV